MQAQADTPPSVEWRYFSLEQVNSRNGPDWKVWEQSEEDHPSLVAFKGAEAARRQGEAGFEHFHLALLEARHAHGQNLDRDTVLRIAQEAGLEPDRFRHDVDDPAILEPLARDHAEAIRQGVFGTPTLCFAQGRAAYMKMRPATQGREALAVYERVKALVADDLNIEELKRPQRRS